MKNTNILITNQQLADAYTRTFQPEISDNKTQKKLKPKKK